MKSSDLKVTMLQQKLVEANAEIQKLKKGVMVAQASQQVVATQVSCHHQISILMGTNRRQP